MHLVSIRSEGSQAGVRIFRLVPHQLRSETRLCIANVVV